MITKEQLGEFIEIILADTALEKFEDRKLFEEGKMDRSEKNLNEMYLLGQQYTCYRIVNLIRTGKIKLRSGKVYSIKEDDQ